MKKFLTLFLFLSLFSSLRICAAADIQSLKIDFLQGNYRRVIFESQIQAADPSSHDFEELNYILGLSYLKETKPELARTCFERIIANKKGKYFMAAKLGLADSLFIEGCFSESKEAYDKLMEQEKNPYKAQILYRFAQIEFKKGSFQKGNDYLSRLRKEFPLSAELRQNTKGIEVSRKLSEKIGQKNDDYSLQAGFFQSPSNAERYKNLLLSKGFPAYIENSSGGYRVKIGKFKTEEEANSWETKLSKQGFPVKSCQ